MTCLNPNNPHPCVRFFPTIPLNVSYSATQSKLEVCRFLACSTQAALCLHYNLDQYRSELTVKIDLKRTSSKQILCDRSSEKPKPGHVSKLSESSHDWPRFWTDLIFTQLKVKRRGRHIQLPEECISEKHKNQWNPRQRLQRLRQLQAPPWRKRVASVDLKLRIMSLQYSQPQL